MSAASHAQKLIKLRPQTTKMVHRGCQLIFAVLLQFTFSGIAASEFQAKPGRNLPEADISAYPWSAIGKLNNSVGGSCTGVVVEQDLALTAAHCIFNPRTGKFLPPSSLHLLLGYRRGDYAVHARVASYSLGPGYDPTREVATIGSDWAMLKLAESLPPTIRPLPTVERVPAVGTHLMIGSYVRSRPYVMTVDNNCRLLATPQQPFLLQHDCQVAQGSSGAPLLALDNGTPIIVGMQVAIGRSNGSNTMLALSAPSIMANLSPR